MKRAAAAAAVCLLLALVLAAGCGKREKFDYTFRGEGGDWSAEYHTVTAGRWTKHNGSDRFSGHTDLTLTVTYAGDMTELPPKRIIVSYDTGSRSGSKELDFLEPSPSGTFTILDERVKEAALLPEDSVIAVSVDVDGVVTELELAYDAS